MNSEWIAVIGTACRFPGAPGLDEFWQLLIEGRDAVTEIPETRWSKPYYFHPVPGQAGKSYTWAAGVLPEIQSFDSQFFGISPREARQMDPQQHILLELVWEALEDAGVPARRLAGSQTGVFVGVSGSDYAMRRLGDPAGGDAYFMTGATSSIVANRISYIFDFHGPSFCVDTACSSSLVALNSACEALRNDHVPIAVVAGVNLLLSPYPFIGFCQASMLSPTGRCHAFDASADGYVRGEGGGVVILKRLRDALADGDQIRAVIAGTAVNSDGRTLGLSLPNERSQADLLKQLYAKSGVAPGQLSFVEAHGTGTAAGDPIELSAIGRTLGSGRTDPLLIGSVKTNIGHLEPASGMAGLIKSILALEHRRLPASLNFSRPNPHIQFEKLNLKVAVAAEQLDHVRPAETIYAGVNSFGFGGTNAHAIVASAPLHPSETSQQTSSLPPLLLSARSAEALKIQAQNWAAQLAVASDDSAARTLRAAARHRDHHRHRIYCSGQTPRQISTTLEAFRSGAIAAETAMSDRVLQAGICVEGKLAFAFSGNGSQYAGMARDALQYSTEFRNALAETDDVLGPMLGWSTSDYLLNIHNADLGRTDVSQPLLFAIQVAITKSLAGQGIRPDFCFGHSVGEIAAAWAAGLLSLADACRIIVARSRHQHRSQGTGGMATIAFPPDMDISALDGSGVEIAAINSRLNITIAGSAAELAEAEATARRLNWRYLKLDIDYPFHSKHLQPIKQDILRDLAGIEFLDGATGFVSTVTGGQLSLPADCPQYWWSNIREVVRFSQAVSYLIKQGARIFVEIGPNPILQSYIRDGLRSADAEGRVLTSLSRNECAGDPFRAIAGHCYSAGYSPAEGPLFKGTCEFRTLPHYPWQRERHWFPVTSEALPIAQPSCDHPLLGFRWTAESREWTQWLDLAAFPWLADHQLDGDVVFPAAALIDMALAVARVRASGSAALSISELVIVQPLLLDPKHSRFMRVRLTDDHTILFESRPRLESEPFILHARARIAAYAGAVPAGDSSALPVTQTIDADTVYARAAAFGLQYGPAFRPVSKVEILTDGSARALFTPAGENHSPGYVLLPQLVDAGFQTLLALESPPQGSSEAALVPYQISGIRVFPPFGRQPSSAVAKVVYRGVRSEKGSVVFFDNERRVVAEIGECLFRQLPRQRQLPVRERSYYWHMQPRPGLEPDVAPAVAWENTIRLPERIGHKPQVPALLHAYIVARAYGELRQIFGCDLNVESAIAGGVMVPEAQPLVCRLLQDLEESGLATFDQNSWKLTDDCELPDSSRIWRTVLAEAPSGCAEVALAAAAAERLGNFIRTGSRFDPPANLVEHLYFSSPDGDFVINHITRILHSIAAKWPNGRPLRILEIGANSGILTRRILGALSSWDGALTYVATDPGPEAARGLSARLQAFPGASVVRWNPSTAFPQSGARFDIAISAAGFTRLTLDDAALETIRTLLAPGGHLVTAEPEPNILFDWIFGQAPEWWQRSVVPEFPVPAQPASSEWPRMLQNAGFPNTNVITDRGNIWPLTIVTADRPRDVTAANASLESRNIAIISDAADPLADALAGEISRLGGTPRLLIRPEICNANAFSDSLSEYAGNDLDIVLLPQRDSSEDIVVEATDGLMHVLNTARLTSGMRASTKLWVITRTAQQKSERQSDGAKDSAIWGFVRTVANEMPQLDCVLLDASEEFSDAGAAIAVARELAAPDGEKEIALTNSGRHVMRLRKGIAGLQRASGPMRLEIRNPGRFDSLCWVPFAPRELASGEVAITNHVAGINFRDVMWALDLLPEEALSGGYSGANLGLACAGIVRAVGADVKSLQPGDRVIAIAPACLATDVIASEHTVVHLPEQLDFHAAATVPVAFATAIYALETVANLKADEHVLIHGGAGGVGLAAIQVAKRKGAVVIATAGSDTKRAFLKQLGADHVFDSRSLSFADGVMQVTGGEGVDVVLNSLNGDAMEQSLKLLRPFGRFVELGKRDFFAGTRVSLTPFRRNVSYHAVDIDALPLNRPELSSALMRDIVQALATGDFHPLPYRAFHPHDVADAFRLMQSAGHIGKIVISVSELRDSLPSQTPASRRFTVRPDATYLITGGLSGFGLATAAWLVKRGARSLALLGRRGIETPEFIKARAELGACGAGIRAFACDVADGESLATTLADIRRDMPPLCGIVHAAMVVEDSLLANIKRGQIARVLAPKLAGAVHLDRLTREDALDFFLFYSSATTVLGAPGQAAYVAANAAVEAIARSRESAGFPSLAIGWGPIEDTGYLARHAGARNELARRLAANPMRANEALDAIPALWSSGQPAVVFASVKWDAARRLLSAISSPVFSEISDGRNTEAAAPTLTDLTILDFESRRAVLLEVLTTEISRILSISVSSIEAHRPITDMGFDSLMGVELRLAVESRIGRKIPGLSLAPETTVAHVAASLARNFENQSTERAIELATIAQRYEAVDRDLLLDTVESGESDLLDAAQ